MNPNHLRHIDAEDGAYLEPDRTAPAPRPRPDPFLAFLERNRAVVERWPQWKRDVLAREQRGGDE